MSTGAERTNFADKRNLPQQRIKDTFFDYLADRLADITFRAWGSQRGVFGTATLTGGADKVSVGVLPVSLLDGDGNVLVVDGTDGANLFLENALGITYYVGARHCLIPSEVERNPRNDVVNYDVWVDAIGESNTPTSVTEVAGQLDVVVDTVCEAGVSCAGRLVTIYLTQPESDVAAVAIERNLVVSWDGTNNRILTAGLLGQTTASTVPSRYVVVAQGVTIRRNTDLSITSPYAFLGTATGAGAGGTPTTSVVGQVDITSGISTTLDEAYNYSTSAAKVITVDDGAIHLEGSAGSGDGQNAILRVSRMGSSDDMQFGVVIQIGDEAAIPFAILEPVDRSAGSDVLRAQETATQTAPDLLDFTRGGALDLTDTDVNIIPGMHVVLIETGPEAGTLYVIKATNSASQLQLMGLQGTGVPSPWTAGAGRTVRVLVPRIIFANPTVHAYVAGSTLDFWKGELHVPRDGHGTSAPIRVVAHAGAVTDNVQEWYTPGGVIHTYLRSDGVWNLGTGSAPAGFNFVANPQGDANAQAMNLYPSVGVAGDLPSMRVLGQFSENSVELSRWTRWGNRLRCARFFEDFLTYTQPAKIRHQANGAGTFAYNGGANATHGGAVHMTTGAVSGNFNEVDGPAAFVLRDTTTPKWRVIFWRARVRLLSLVTQVAKVGMRSLSTGGVAYFRYENGVAAGNWQFRNDDGGGGAETTADTGVAAASGTVNDDNAWVDMWAQLDLENDLITYWMTGMAAVATQAFENAPTGWVDVRSYPFAKIETSAAGVRSMQVSEMEAWDEIITGGPHQ